LAPLILAFLLAELPVIQYTKLRSNIRDPLFSQICRGREIREIKGTRKFWVLQYVYVFLNNGCVRYSCKRSRRMYRPWRHSSVKGELL